MEPVEIEGLDRIRRTRFVRLQCHVRCFARLQPSGRQSAQTPRIVRRAAESEFAKFSVADDVNAGLGLFTNDFDYSAPHSRLQRVQVDGAARHDVPCHLDQVGRPVQPARVCGQNTIGTPFHWKISIGVRNSLRMAPQAVANAAKVRKSVVSMNVGAL